MLSFYGPSSNQKKEGSELSANGPVVGDELPADADLQFKTKPLAQAAN